MIRCIPKKLSIAVLLSGLSINALAANGWSDELLQTLRLSPQWQQLDAKQVSAQADSRAAQQPLYNPELELSYEDKTERAYQVTVSQTIDLFDKRETQSQMAMLSEQISLLDIQAQKTLLLEQVLTALLESRRASALANLSASQLQISERLIALTRKRMGAGDASQIDLQLVQLAHTEALESNSAALEALLQRQSDAALVLGDTEIRLPRSFDYSTASPPDFTDLSRQTLNSQIALLETRKAQLEIAQAAKARRIEPTVGLGFGQEGNDNVIALSLSIPLNVRNTYRAEVDAAEARAAYRDDTYLLIQQQSHNELKRSWTLLTQQQALKHLLADTGQQSMQTLNQQFEKLWRLGELDTTRYLQSLQQSNSALKAQINLNTESDLALIQWLARSNQLLSWLSPR